MLTIGNVCVPSKRFQWSLSSPKFHLTAVAYAPYAQINGSKRAYLSDLKPFSDVYSTKNLTYQLLKAVLLPTQLILNDFTKHENETLELEEEDRTDFDWDGAIQSRMQLFWPLAAKFLTVSAGRSVLEHISLAYLPVKIVDRLTKDLTKSIYRKYAKYSRFTACTKIMHTALWSCIPINCSLLLYDVLEHLFLHLKEAIYAAQESKLITKRMVAVVKFTSKKFVYYSVCVASSAVGFGVGSYVNVKYGGGLGSLLFELFAGAGVAVAMGL